MITDVGVAAEKEEKKGLVVHEWGVLVRQNTTPETVGAADALLASLPGFVGKHGSSYKPRPMIQVFRKPVLHFYGEEQEVVLQIMTPSGRPMAYWPMPRYLEGHRQKSVGPGAYFDAVGMIWNIKLTEAKPGIVQDVEDDHWWAKIRTVDSLWVETKEALGEHGRPVIKPGAEKFLFYEATGRSEPTVKARIEGDMLHLDNGDGEDAGPILVIVNNGKERYLEVVDKIEAGRMATIKKAEMMAEPTTLDVVREAAREQWLSYGMTEEEATMIVSVWEEDLWETKGFLVVSRMPSSIYDKQIFPIDINPEPAELVRAAVIFDNLPGLNGRLEWLPGFNVKLEKLLGGLGSADPRVREAATSGLAEYGDLAMEVVKKGMLSEDPETKMRSESLFKKLEPKPVEEGPVGQGFVPLLPDGIVIDG